MVTKNAQSEPGNWSNTTVGVGLGGRIYTVEKDGTLYSTSTKKNDWTVLGSNYKSRLLVASGTENGWLFTITEDGTLYKVNPNNGDIKQIGDDGAWSDAVVADAIGDTMYYISDEGKLISLDLAGDEGMKEIGSGYDPKMMWAWQDSLYVLQKDGSLYKASIEDGTWELFGEEEAYADTVAATIHNGVFYAIEDDGALGATSLDGGAYEEPTDEDFTGTRYLFSAGKYLYAIHKNGTLYRVEV